MGLHVGSISSQSVPIGANELDGFIRLWGREAVLANCALLLECHEADSMEAARANAISRLIDALNCPLIISSVARLRASHKAILTFDVNKPSASEQRDSWHEALMGMPVNLNGRVSMLVSQFSLSLQKVHAARADAIARQHH